jgi:hypothetical protein
LGDWLERKIHRKFRSGRHSRTAHELISIDPNLEELLPLTMELSQPTHSINTVGEIVIDKAPDGSRSPNLADAIMICYQSASRSMEVWLKLGSML